MKTAVSLSTALLLSTTLVQAGLLDVFGAASPSTNAGPLGASGLNALSQDQVVQGLKEALSEGVGHAVSQLGQADGFLTNLSVKIPMPEKLRTVEKTLRTLKQDQLADDFVSTMNHAAEQAVPVAAGVFADAIKGMSIEDAKAILTGPNDAATKFFRKATQTNLFEQFLPIVRTATDKAGVTAKYKQMTAAASGKSLLGSFGESLLGTESIDLDGYVTQKALDGLFTMVAAEENRIRENPAARSTELLQQVFGAAVK
jgi:hypothetical protein